MPSAASAYPAYIIGAAGIGVGVLGLIAPAAHAELFGIPTFSSLTSVELTHPAAHGGNAALSSWVAAKAARDVVLGLVLTGLQLRRNVDGVSTMFVAMGALGIMDGWLVWQATGDTTTGRQKAVTHAGGAALLAVWAIWHFYRFRR
jgi:hypothetical protein